MDLAEAALDSIIACDLKATIPFQVYVGNACLDYHVPAWYLLLVFPELEARMELGPHCVRCCTKHLLERVPTWKSLQIK